MGVFGAIWKRIKLFALAEDMNGNVLLLLNKPGKTMSLTFARWRKEGNAAQRQLGKRMCIALDAFDKGHCDKVLAAEERRKKDKDKRA